MPVRIRFLHTLFGHWSARSGYLQLIEHLDRERFSPVVDGVADKGPFFDPRGDMPWYRWTDFIAELRALPGGLSGACDIVHFLDGEHAGRYLPAWLRRVGRRPRIVATFHQPHTLQPELISREAARRLDHVIVLSPSQVPFFRELLPEERIHLLPHGVDTGFFHPPAVDRPPDRPLRCLTVGHWLRDWESIRRVAQAHPRVWFDVVTSGETGLEGMANVTHRRHIPDIRLAALYRQADVLLLPLTESTANNALLEGLASGLPIISTDLPGVRFHLGGGEGFMLAPPGDAEACIDMLRRVQHDPELRATMARQSRARAEQLAWPRVAGRFAQLYRAIAAERPLAQGRAVKG